MKTRRQNQERPIMTWNEMKVVMRKILIPNHYYHDLHNELQGLNSWIKECR